MDELLYGNYEINISEGYIRLKVGDDDYEYIVSEELFGSKQNAMRACRVFQTGFHTAKRETSNQLRGLLNTS